MSRYGVQYDFKISWYRGRNLMKYRMLIMPQSFFICIERSIAAMNICWSENMTQNNIFLERALITLVKWQRLCNDSTGNPDFYRNMLSLCEHLYSFYQNNLKELHNSESCHTWDGTQDPNHKFARPSTHAQIKKRGKY